MSRVVFRPSVAADFLILVVQPPLYRCRCITAVVDGKPIGLGGVLYPPGGDVWASVLISEEARRYPVAIHRAGIEAVAMFKRLGLKRVYAQAEGANARARAWLDRLGFASAELAGGEIFVWNCEKAGDDVE